MKKYISLISVCIVSCKEEEKIKYNNSNQGKRTMLFFFLIQLSFLSGQTIIKNSDNEQFDSVEILKFDGKKIILSKNQIKTFDFSQNDKVSIKNKAYDFSVSNDTLVIFDKTKEIEEIALSNISTDEENKTYKSSKRNATAEVFANGFTATYIRLNTSKATYLKSIIVFPKRSFNFTGKFEGTLHIKIVKNLKGFPDDHSELISFSKDLSEIKTDKYGNAKNWEIQLPKIIKYLPEGFFIVFNLEPLNKSSIALELNGDSQMFMYYPQTKEWKGLSDNGYRYKLKILQ